MKADLSVGVYLDRAGAVVQQGGSDLEGRAVAVLVALPQLAAMAPPDRRADFWRLVSDAASDLSTAGPPGGVTARREVEVEYDQMGMDYAADYRNVERHNAAVIVARMWARGVETIDEIARAEAPALETSVGQVRKAMRLVPRWSFDLRLGSRGGQLSWLLPRSDARPSFRLECHPPGLADVEPLSDLALTLLGETAQRLRRDAPGFLDAVSAGLIELLNAVRRSPDTPRAWTTTAARLVLDSRGRNQILLEEHHRRLAAGFEAEEEAETARVLAELKKWAAARGLLAPPDASLDDDDLLDFYLEKRIEDDFPGFRANADAMLLFSSPLGRYLGTDEGYRTVDLVEKRAAARGLEVDVELRIAVEGESWDPRHTVFVLIDGYLGRFRLARQMGPTTNLSPAALERDFGEQTPER